MKELLEKLKAALAKKDGGDAEAETLITEHVEADTKELRAKRDDLLAQVADSKKKLRQYADVDLEEYKAQADKIDELEKSLSSKPDVDKEVKRATDKATKELDKLQKQLATEKAVVHRLTVDSALTSELAAIGVVPTAMQYVRGFLAQQAKVTEDGEERTATIGDKPLKDAVATWAKSEEAKVFIRAAPSGGGGSSNNGGGQPAGKSIKLTEFNKLGAQEQMDFMVKDHGVVVEQ